MTHATYGELDVDNLRGAVLGCQFLVPSTGYFILNLIGSDKQTMPKFVKDAHKYKGLESAYNDRPPYQRNDYLWWINDAKKDETKQKHRKKMLSELKQGHGYMNNRARNFA